MRYLGLGVSFGLVAFLMVNTAASVLVLLLWRALRPKLREAALPLFLLRMIPAASSLAVAGGLAVPSFVLFEPRETSEIVGPKLIAVAALAGALIAVGLYRGLASWLATRRLARAWLAEALPVQHPGVPVPVYRIRSEAPIAALVGVIRPRLFVSNRFLEALSPNEERAVLGHEMGHLVASDNLKRTVMRLAPDWLSLLSLGRGIDAAWAAAAEESADDSGRGRDRASALDLASSILKAARLTRPGAGEILSASTFCDRRTIARRVARLLHDRPARVASSLPFPLPLATTLALLAGTALCAEPALRTAYVVTEAVIRLLQ